MLGAAGLTDAGGCRTSSPKAAIAARIQFASMGGIRGVVICFLAHPRYERLAQAAGLGAVARIAMAAATFLGLPLAVRYLGAERYGVWATVTMATAWVNLLDLGVNNTLTNHVSRAYACNDHRSAASYVTNAVVLTGGMATLGAIAFALAWRTIDWNVLFHVRVARSSGEVRDTVAVAAGLVLLGLPIGIGNKVLAGYQELHRAHMATCAGALGSLAGLAVGVWLGLPMPLLFLVSAGCIPFAGLATLLWLFVKHKPWLRPRFSLIRGTALRELLRSGSSFFLIQIAALIVFSSDNLIVSHYLGAAEVTPYSVAWRLIGMGAILQSLVFPALWPAYAEAYSRGDYRWIQRTFHFAIKGAIAMNFICAVMLAIGGRELIRFWAGGAAVPSEALLVAMGAWSVINGFMNVESCLLAALNRVRAQAVLSIVAAGVNLALSIFLVQRIGSLGVIVGTIASYLLVLVIPQTLIVRRAMLEMSSGDNPADNIDHTGPTESARAAALPALNVSHTRPIY